MNSKSKFWLPAVASAITFAIVTVVGFVFASTVEEPDFVAFFWNYVWATFCSSLGSSASHNF